MTQKIFKQADGGRDCAGADYEGDCVIAATANLFAIPYDHAVVFWTGIYEAIYSSATEAGCKLPSRKRDFKNRGITMGVMKLGTRVMGLQEVEITPDIATIDRVRLYAPNSLIVMDTSFGLHCAAIREGKYLDDHDHRNKTNDPCGNAAIIYCYEARETAKWQCK